MKTWCNLGLSVTPKAHIFEYHAIESMQDINSLGDNIEYFIDLSHQDITHQDRHTQGLRDYKEKHKYKHKAEHKE